METEVLQVRWEADEDGLSATAIAEFDINSRWSGVEILDQNFLFGNPSIWVKISK